MVGLGVAFTAVFKLPLFDCASVLLRCASDDLSAATAAAAARFFGGAGADVLTAFN